MSSFNNDMVSGFRSIGERLNDFMYDGKPKRGVKQEHTKEELEQMLESIRKECWEMYDDGAKYLGWKE